MMPAMPNTPAASQTSTVKNSSVCSMPSSVVTFSPGLAVRVSSDGILPPARLTKHIISVGVKRVRVLDHYVIVDVHVVVEGPSARRDETTLHPLRRWLDLNVLDQHGGEARIEFGVANRQAKLSFERRTRLN